MLVLSRKVSQTIRLPDADVTVTVAAVKGGTVKLGIDAPPAVVIVRGEKEERPAGVSADVAPALSIPPPEGTPASYHAAALKQSLHRLALHAALAELDSLTPDGRFEAMFDELARAGRLAHDDRGPASRAAISPVQGADLASVERALLVSPAGADRTLTATLLTRWGIDVELADGPTAAAKRLTVHGAAPIDLVLVDLPDERPDAAESVRRLREAAAIGQTPAIRLLELGFEERPSGPPRDVENEYLAKPFDPRSLAARLRPLAMAG